MAVRRRTTPFCKGSIEENGGQSTRQSKRATGRLLYGEFELFSTSGSEEEARGESDQELIIGKPKADIKI